MPIKNETTANEAISGFEYQNLYALWLLLKHGLSHPDSKISIERYDDVAYHEIIDGTERLILFQTKLHLSNHSLTKASPDFWKTVNSWIIAIKQDTLNKIDTLNLITSSIVKSKNVFINDLMIKPIDRSKTKNKEILKQMLETATKSDAKDTKNGRERFSLDRPSLETLENYKRLGKEFLKLETEQEQIDFISKIHIQIKEYKVNKDYSPDSLLKDIKRELYYAFDDNELYFNSFYGYWRLITIPTSENTVLQDGVCITLEQLHNQIKEIKKQDRSDFLPYDLLREPITKDEIIQKKAEYPLFVKQLNIIGIDNNKAEVNDAVENFIKATNQRNQWFVEKGLITQQELDDFEYNLKDNWNDEYNELKREIRGKSEEEITSMTENKYHKFMKDAGSKANLSFRNGHTPKSTLIKGSYHILADRSDFVLGWHLNFKPILDPKYASSKLGKS